MRYRRAFTPGGTFFFTLVTEGRRPVFASAAAVEVLSSAFRSVRQARPFEMNAMVVMPDHLHCIWTLPSDDADFSTRWRLIKTWFTKHHQPDQRAQAIWQPRFWEHQIWDEDDLDRHVDYIHYNPVKLGLAASPRDCRVQAFATMLRPEFIWTPRARAR